MSGFFFAFIAFVFLSILRQASTISWMIWNSKNFNYLRQSIKIKYANLTEALQRVGISKTGGIIAAGTPHVASKCHDDPSISCQVVVDRLSPLSQTGGSAAEKHHLQNSFGEV